MHERERWQIILREAREHGLVRVHELIAATAASPATLRRDLAKLEQRGHVRRVHGGVELADPAEQLHLATRGFNVSKSLNAANKLQVAEAAAKLCVDGDSIILNAGSTTWYMAEFLRRHRMQILTNSMPIAQELIVNSTNRIVLPGGEVYREQGIIMSPFDHDATQHFTASKMFMSCLAITSMGIIEGDPLIARAEAKLLARAEKLIVVADSSKFEPRGSIVVCQLSRVHTLVTDDGAPRALLDHIRSRGVTVVIAAGEENKSRTAA